MKKIASLIIAAVMLVSVCACTAGSKKPGATATDVTYEDLQEIIKQSAKQSGEESD